MLDLDAPVGLATPADPPMAVEAVAPGRVNLIGEHTDYSGGLALPLAVDLGTTVTGTRIPDRITLTSGATAVASEPEVDLAVAALSAPDLPSVSGWGAYVAAVAAGLWARGQLGGLRAHIDTTLPVGAGLSSSAALTVSVALALGFAGTRRDLVWLARDAEEQAVGVPCGLLDQLASVCGVDGHALLVDFTDLAVTPVPLPDDLEVVVVHSGEERTLAGSAYAERRQQCEQAAAKLGPLRSATLADANALTSDILRRRARHVVSENARVLATVEALGCGDRSTVGSLLAESHRSLRDDFAVSTPTLDALVDRLNATPGVFGARLTGGGFGGCVVACSEPGVLEPGPGVWPVRASGGAHVRVTDDRATPSF